MSTPALGTPQSPPEPRLPNPHSALVIALGYALAGGLWTIGTDWLVQNWVEGALLKATLTTLKGYFFIAVTALALGAALNRYFRRARATALALQAWNDQLPRAVLDNVPDPVWMKDLEGRFQLVNEAWCRFTGLGAAEALGRSDAELFSVEAGRRFREQERAVAAAAKPMRWDEEIQSGQGQVHAFETYKSPVFDAAGRIVATTGIGRDVTERRRLESESQIQGERLRLALEAAEMVSWDLDVATGRITYSANLAMISGPGDVSPYLNLTRTPK